MVRLDVRTRAAALAAGLAALMIGGAAPASAAGPFVEVNYQDPITAAPPPARPDTRHCTVTLMQHDFAFSFGQPFVGAYTPPADCPGPWSGVFLDWNGSIAGRQFDRFGGVWIGGVELFRFTTPEPDPAGIHWHVEKDVSQYTSTLQTPQTVVVDLGNLINSTFTGVFHTSLSLTFFTTDRRHPAAAHPDLVVPISTGSQAPGWFFLNKATDTAAGTVTLPTNLTSARLQVFATSHGCEEQWFTNVPDAFTQKDPAAGLCGGGAFRELRVLLDGALVGVATPFPVVYSGGLNPLMWRPIPAVGQFDIPPYPVDLTPFVGVLTDGRPHTIAVAVANNEGFWPVDADLLLDRDPRAAVTHGAVLRNTLAPDAAVEVRATSEGAVDHLVTSARRDWLTEGWVDTSAGRVTTTVEQRMRTVNDQRNTLNGPDVLQVVGQRQQTGTAVTSRARGRSRTSRVEDDSPLRLTEDFTNQVQPSGHASFTIRSAMDVALDREARADGAPRSSLRDRVTATGILVRDTVTGQNLAADGTDAERYVSRSGERCFDHLLRARHGFVTLDRVRRSCGDDPSET